MGRFRFQAESTHRPTIIVVSGGATAYLPTI
jgi:hypothetical protein